MGQRDSDMPWEVGLSRKFSILMATLIEIYQDCLLLSKSIQSQLLPLLLGYFRLVRLV